MVTPVPANITASSLVTAVADSSNAVFGGNCTIGKSHYEIIAFTIVMPSPLATAVADSSNAVFGGNYITVLLLVQDPRVVRPYLFSDGQNMCNRVVLVCTVNVGYTYR